MKQPRGRALDAALIVALDVLILALLALSLVASLAGGIPWQGRMILRHAADPRRAVILVAIIAALASSSYRTQGLIPRAARAVASWLERPSARWTLITGWIVLMIGVSITQALALRTPLWDVGIFHQIIWAIGHGHGFLSSISGAGNFLTDHLAPALALLVPAFWLTGSSPLTLPVIQPLLLGAGGAAWVWLAERLGGARMAAATAVFVVSFDSLWGNVAWGFHENAIAFATTSWALALILTGRAWFPLALLALSAASKETLLLQIGAMLAIWAWLDHRKSAATALKLLAALALAAAFLKFQSIEHPANKNYFARYYAYLGLNSADFLRGLITAPASVIRNVGIGEILRYLKTAFLPFFPILFLARMRDRRLLWLAAITTSFMSALMATYPPLRQPGFHYVLELWPVLACLAVAAISRHASPKIAWAWAILALFALDHDPLGSLREFGAEAAARAEARSRMREIPIEASVAASELAGPWVASRERVTRTPELPSPPACPEWLVVQEGDSAAMKLMQSCGGVFVWRAADWQAYHRD